MRGFDRAHAATENGAPERSADTDTDTLPRAALASTRASATRNARRMIFTRACVRARRTARASRHRGVWLMRSITLLIAILLVALASTLAYARALDDIADAKDDGHTRAPDVSSLHSSESDRASRLQAQWEAQRAFTKALRHPRNDLSSVGACKDVISQMCGSVVEARALLDRAWRYVVQEENLEEHRGPLRASFGGGRSLLYSSSTSSRSRYSTATNRGSTSAPRSMLRDDYNSREKEKAEATASNREAEAAAARAEREKQEKEAAFERLKAFPAGTLAHDPHKVEADIKSIEAQIAANEDSSKLPILKRQLEAAQNEKEKMIAGAFASESRSAGSFHNNHADDHWFLEDRQGSKNGYRHRRGKIAPELTARQRYDFMATKVPDFSKSYFDCVGHVIKVESEQRLQEFMMSGTGALKNHKTIVSNQCKVELKSKMRDVYDAFQSEKPLLDHCVDDIKTKCAHMDIGYGLITTCLLQAKTESASSFAPSCEQALSAVKTKAPDDKHPTDELTKHVEIEANTVHAPKVDTQPTLTQAEQHIVNSVEEESQAEKDERDAKIAKKFEVEDPTPTKDNAAMEKKEDASKPTTQQERVVLKEPALSKSTEDLEAKLREANARIKLAEAAAAHASAQTRNFVFLLIFVAIAYGVTRKGSRRRIVFILKKLRLSQKGAQL